MASSSCWKLNALIKKNLLSMRRNIISTIAEIFFPMLLMIIVLIIRKVFDVKYYRFEKQEQTDDNFFYTKSTSFLDPNTFGGNLDPMALEMENWNGISKRSLFHICNELFQTPRNKIATVGIPIEIKNAIIDIAAKSDNNVTLDYNNFTDFSSTDELDEYVKASDYGSEQKPLLCFGIHLSENNGKYEYSLHYFDNAMDEAVQDVPDGRVPANDEFQDGPDMESYVKYIGNGYPLMLRIISEYILQKEIDPSASVNFGMMANKYEYYREDPFGNFVGYIVPFFITVAYMCPLCLYVLRMVTEKESRAKEGMKIMGMGEGTYFLSYFIQYFIINIFYTIGNGVIIHFVFEHIPIIYLFLTYFLWGLDIFALAFFFQSFIDRTRVALILSLLVYFVMLFMSMAVINESVAIGLKVLVTIFPPVAIELGIIVYGKFESRFKNFTSKHFNKRYTNYKISYMMIMFIVDFFLYLFLGYYLQNIVSHEFGISKPFYFLCTRSYWCGNKKKKKTQVLNQNLLTPNKETNQATENQKTRNGSISSSNESNSVDKNDLDINNNNDPNFQSEELYKDRTGKKDSMKIRKLVKQFDDGKVAVNGVSLNLYRDEIFALLGHNGAGKSTMISMLCGLYDSTSGSAFYDGVDILDGNQMEIFRTKLGICPQHDVLFDDLTIAEHLSMFSTFKGVSSQDVDEEINKTLKDFQLEDMKNVVAKNLSAGQRRKLSIAISIIGGSEVIFLDEPSSGMDITSRRNLWEILKRMTEKRIIILTTHYMEEASVLGNRIGIINSGEMKCIGTPLFLIERFGKFMSINITKEENANNQEIIDFISSKANDVEYEILSEEIMFRIPKSNYLNEQLTLSENGGKGKTSDKNSNNNGFNIEDFFKELDSKCEELKIKSYSASMPTLEDVFLNVAAEDTMKIQGEHRKFSQTNESNDKILFEQDFREDFSKKSKFYNDLETCLKKRWYQVYRDMKSVFLEILCPIILILIGLLVSQVKFNFSSSPQEVDIGILGEDTIFYGMKGNADIPESFLKKPYNCTYKVIKTPENSYSDDTTAIRAFYDTITNENDETNLGSMYILSVDNYKYSFVEFINTRARQGAAFFSHYFLKQIIEHAAKTKGKNIEIKFTHYPMPLTKELQSHADQTSNSTVVFFVAVAFSLIPANFVTIIVKERVNNSKHLMRISGISLFAYWLSNFIIETLKYYFTAGVCVFLIWAFDFYEKYFVVFYLVYGPPMVLSTYIVSFLFDNEASAQNGVILLNFLIGALGSSVVLIFRGWDTLIEVGKGLAYAFSLLPSFSFAYAFTSLLNRALIYIADEPEKYWLLLADEHKIIELKYTGQQILYLCVEFVVYGFLLALVEKIEYTFYEPPNERISTNVKDEEVLKEIERSSGVDSKVNVVDENGRSPNGEEPLQYAVHIQNLQKKFSDPEGKICSGEQREAIKNLSFCLEYGECFGLLGVNGAGKTTTFRCITQEHGPTNGRIYVNGYDLGKNFSKVSQMFGYCPQFDAIFEYMTVYENLEFYAKLKGVQKDKLNKMLLAMIDEMSLSEFTTKIAGRLSGGNKRKLSVAISMICNPPIILLDEPSTGMDPEARRFMWAVIHKISTRRKKSAVIMTTHSMDEAETLCKRMGIMVNGELVCLGSSQNIKEKYGYGFEVDLSIKPLTEEKYNEIVEKYALDKKLIVRKDNLKEVLGSINKDAFYKEFAKGRLGEKINTELEIKGRLKIKQLVTWIFFVQNALKLIKKAKENFEEIILTEFIDNNFLFKIKKSENGKSIGFLFGLFESLRNECNVTEYSIQQTSLEQIFNQFAARQGKSDTQEIEAKTEIPIDDNLLKDLLTE